MGATITRRQQSRELGYAEIVSNASVTATSFTLVSGLVLSNLVIPADRPVRVMIYCGTVSHATANGQVQVSLWDQPATTNYGGVKFVSATANATAPVLLERRFAAGTCPANLAAYALTGSGTGTLFCASPFVPTYIQAVAL